MDNFKILICVEKSTSRMLNWFFMTGQIRAGRFYIKNIAKVKSEVKRCRVLEFMNKIESTFKRQIMTA